MACGGPGACSRETASFQGRHTHTRPARPDQHPRRASGEGYDVMWRTIRRNIGDRQLESAGFRQKLPRQNQGCRSQRTQPRVPVPTLSKVPLSL